MMRHHDGFCLHEHRKIAAGVLVFFAYLFVLQTVHLMEGPPMISIIHSSLRMSMVTILLGIVCAIGIFIEVKCTSERIVLALVLGDSLGHLVAILVNSPSAVREWRLLSTVIRLACVILTGRLALGLNRNTGDHE